MAFNSFNFWLVFPFIFGFYWLIPGKYNQARKVFLILVSYLLYMNWKPAFALVLLGVTLITYWGGQIFDSERVKNEELKVGKRKRLIWIFALLGLLPLLVFKYYNFINNSLTDGLAAIGLKFSMPGLNWAVPVGISFFTFQAVGYMLDVYHQRVKAEKNLLDYVLFVSFFPQVTSGPISTAEDLMPQIKATHKFDYEQGKQGLKQLLWGMFIKLVIADRLGLFVDTVYANYIHYNGTTCFLASVFYTLQIYCDFAGYSLMAIGIARTLGFNLIDNFRRPYLATSITDFWKRWHISLTRWLTRQVYIPMGGSRCSKPRTYWNIFVTFLVSGIWHGANWTFIVWGCMHGIIQIIEKALGWQKYEGHNWAIKLFRIVVTFLLVNIAWVFFRMPNIGDAFAVIVKMFTDFGVVDFNTVFSGFAPVLILVIGLSILTFKEIREEFCPNKMQFLEKPFMKFASCVVLFIIILSMGVLDGGQFIYVNF
jgi:D-alanyl-lipoteichoic acid acyltransferase DltB (MBOAT superfamily)